MDPNQPKPLMKLPISIRQDSSLYRTSVLIDSAESLNFVSQVFLTRNNILGKCTRGPKIDVRVLNEQRISTSKTYVPTNVSLGQKMLTMVSTSQLYRISNVWILSLVSQQ